MGHNFRSQKILVTLLVSSLLVQNVISAECKEGCANPNTSSKLKYEAGKVYNYNFESVATVQLAGADAQETSIKIQGLAQIFPADNCAYTLKFKQVNTFGPDNKKINVVNELSKPVRFYLSNDQLTPEICADGNDNDFSLNIKRGIISVFQTYDQGSTETDVFGRCPTTYSSSRQGNVVTITKTRNLDQCSYREKLQSGMITGIVDDNSEVKSTPLLNGDYSSEVKVKNGLVESAYTTEEYMFVPFSTNEAGARAKVQTKVTLQGQQSASNVPKVNNANSRSIIFASPKSAPAGNIATLKAVFQNTLKEFHNNNVGANAAAQFTELIRLMRNSKRDDLTSLYQQVKAGTLSDNKQLSRKVFFDAIYRCGTGDSVEALANLLKNRELNEKEQKLLYLSLNLVQSMTKEALNSVTKLLDGNPPKEAYLSVGHVVSKYCRDHDCEASDIKAISDKFVQKLGSCKPNNRDEEDILVAVLKGIRNTQNLVNPVLDKVTVCTNDKTTTRIRVAALQAFAANACHKKVQNNALTILKNRNEDSEIRIEAYLAAVECPSTTLANEIKALIDSEPVYQVGSYITSHLANIRASTDPKREAAREFLKDIQTDREFPFDPRRYSFNREFSYAIDSIGFGSSIDTNVVYSQKSFLPRSARVNLTGELFGNSFNVLEFNGRQENLDLFVEHYFGPKGVISSQSTQELISNFLKGYKDMEEQTINRLARGRGRRGVKEDVNSFDKSVKFGNDFNQDLDLDFSLKFFGSELFFLSLGQNLPSTPKELLNFFIESLDGGLKDAKNFDHTFEHHALFLDAEAVYPSALGLPLKLSAKGSGVVRFEVGGEIDIRKMLDDPKNAKFRLKVVPSFNTVVNGLISFDALAVNTGLEVTGSLHSATGSDVSVQTVNGKSFKVNLGMPLKKQEIFKLSHTINFVSQERGNENVKVPLQFSSKPNEFFGCFDQVDVILGVTLCSKSSFTKPATLNVAPFPLNGPNEFDIHLEVAENFLFSVEYDDADPQQPSLTLLFDTPQDPRSRKLMLRFETAFKEDLIMAGFVAETVIGKVQGEAGFKNNDKEVVLYGVFNNDENEHKLEVGFSKSGNDQRQEYKPIFNLNVNYQVDGSIVVEKKGTLVKYTFNNIRISPPGQSPFTVNGDLSRDQNKLTGDLTFALEDKKANIKGTVELATENVLFDVTVSSNLHDQANGRVLFAYNRSPLKGGTSIKNNFLVIYGKDLNSKVHRVEFTQTIDLKENAEKKTVGAKFNNKLYVGELPVTLEVKGETDRKVLKFDVTGQYQKQKANFNFNQRVNQKAKGDYDLSISAGLNDNTISLTSTRGIEGDKSRLTNKLETSVGIRAELNGLIGHKFTYKDADVNLQGVIVPGAKKDAYKLNVFIQNNDKESNSNVKFVFGKIDYLVYDGKLVYGNPHTGEFKAQVHDILDATASYKSNNGVGDGTLLIDLKKYDRKLKGETKFTVQKPTYDVSVDFFYDFDKDNTKKASFVTNNKVTKNSFESKNTVEVMSEKYGFKVSGSQQGPIKDGVTKANVEVSLPSNRRFAINFQRELRVKNNKPRGSIDFKVVDELPNHTRRQVTFNGKMNNADFEAGYFDVLSTIKYKDLANKEISIDTTLKNQKKGHFSTGGVTLKVDGTMITQPLNLNVNLDEYCADHAVYKIVGSYGGKYTVDMKGKYYVANAKRPHSHELKATVMLPDTKLEKIIINSVGKLKEPKNDNDFLVVEYRGSLEYSDNKVGVDTVLKASRKEGNVAITLEIPKRDPIQAQGKYTYSFDGKTNTRSAEGEFDLLYEPTKKFHFDGNTVYVYGKDLKLNANVKCDLEQVKDISLQYQFLRENEETYVNRGELKVDNAQYRLNSKVVNSVNSPVIDVTIDYPQNTMKFYLQTQKLSERKRSLNLNVENFADFSLTCSVETDYSSFENFYIKGDVHSEKLKANKVNFDIRTKSGNSKGVEFKVTSNGANVLTGSADFTTKVDKGRTVIEGQGNVKYYEKANTITFKVIRHLFEGARDGEAGVGATINISVGPQTLALDWKATDKNFLAKYTMCQQNKQCINVEATSQFEGTDGENFKHVLLISVDLRELGYTHEFGLKADTARDGFLVSHNVDMHLQADNKPKYQYNFYVQPKKSGVVITLPTRVIAIESVYTYPDQTAFGKYEASANFYLDKKNEPNKKAGVTLDAEIKRAANNLVIGTAQFAFIHSALKPLKVSGSTEFDPQRQLIKGRLEADVFQKPNDKIIITGLYGNTDTTGNGYNITADVSVVSKGLNLNAAFTGHSGLSFERRLMTVGGSVVLPVDDFKFGTNMFISDEGFEVIALGFNEELLRANGQWNVNKQDLSFGSNFKYLGTTPVVLTGSVKGLSYATFKGTRGALAVVEGLYDLGKELSVKIDSNSKNVFLARIALDQAHFLSTEYKVESNEIKEFVKQVQEAAKTDAQSAEQKLTEKYNAVVQNFDNKLAAIQKAAPNFQKVSKEYQDELKQLLDELKQDDTFKEAIEFITNVFVRFIEVSSVLVESFNDVYEKVYTVASEVYEKFVETFKEKILPDLQAIYGQVQQVIMTAYEDTVKLLTGTFERVTKALKVVEDDFNKIAKGVSEIFQSLSEIVTQYIDIIRKELDSLCQLIKEQIQNIPGFDVLREKYEEFATGYGLSEQLVNILKEFTSAITDLLPSEEVKEFVNKLSDYVEKKLGNEQVNDIETLKELYVSLVKAVRSVAEMVRQQGGELSESTFALPFSFEAFKRMPFITGIRLSPLNYLRNERWVSLRDLVYLYRPYAFDISEAIPPFTMHGEVVDGSHIFTFDGKHYTFPGKCSYILARDFVNGNFSLVANMADGKLKSVTLIDKEGVVEVNNEGVVTLNGKASELPIHLNDLHAWRRYYTVSLLTTYGVEVTCSTDLRVCHFSVSGYYLGKTRGLLGNGNSEPYDDYLLPSNKVTENTAEFGNSYRTQSGCQAVAIQEEHTQHEHADEYCAKFFSGDSPMRYGFLFVNPSSFRNACEHATHDAADDKKLDAACNVAYAYTSRSRLENIPISMPSECAKCSVNNEPVDIGDEFSVKTPQKQSDVVVIVDTKLGNLMSELVQGIINELRNNLKQRDISDVNIAIIGYNKDHKYLYHFTSKGKLDFTGKLATVNAAGPEEEKPLKTGNDALDEFFETINNATVKLRDDLGLSADAQAFREAMEYPFRASATKTILAVRSDSLAYSPNPAKVFAGILSSQTAKNRGVGLHVITPIEELTLTKDANKAATIVAFDSRVVITANDKRRPNMGSVDMRNSLKFKADMGTDLVEKNNGYVVVLQNFINAKPQDKKKFISNLSYILAEQISRTEIQSDCTCRLINGLYPETECKAKESRLLPPKRMAAKG